MATVVTQRIGHREKPKRLETLDITVLAGGPGSEREVSVASGQAVSDALRRLGHNVELADIAPGNLGALDRPADFVFIALHGEFGEDGAVQDELESRGLAYSGSGPRASRLAMNKAVCKRVFEQAGVPTPQYLVATADNLAAIAESFEPPAVVKPVASGSSVDTSIVRTREALARDVRNLIDKYGDALIERYVRGPELTVGIIGDQPLPVCEIRTKREFYDYQAKYVDDDTQYVFDTSVSKSVGRRVQELSLTAHRALGCRAFSRIDWMIDASTDKPFALEVNTIPGFTSHSLLPKAAARVGIGFDELCQKILELSFEGRE